jgi:two-component system, NtrC family, response regulator AtoC
MPHALVVEDDPHSLSALAEVVELEGFTSATASTLDAARALLGAHQPDLVLVDLMLPDGSGIDLLKDTAGSGVTEVVVITGHASVDSAVQALRMGAADYLTKPVDIARLRTILTNVKRTRELKDEIDMLRDELRSLGRFGPMIGGSPPMGKVYDLISRVAPTDATVLITGESGTGKELAAQTVHQLSRRRKAPFLPINCGAVSPNLIESELFGHERGSFTGAERTHKGHFERASGGTLFLDEITEMPMELQVKLLRVLETGTLMRVGGERPIEVDVRLIAATNRVPEDAVRDGKLREDLLYRLKVFPLTLPPLRERPGDLELLVNHFLQDLNKEQGADKQIGAAALERLRKHHWPGNVRELKNTIHRAFILADADITPECLPEEVGGAGLLPARSAAGAGPSVQVAVGTSAADAERQLIIKTLAHYAGDKQKTAEVLGISVKTLYNRLNAYKGESAD